MPISVNRKTISIRQAKDCYLQNCPNILRPTGLLDQILTRYDFGNRKFSHPKDLLIAMVSDISEEAVELDMASFKKTGELHAQFKHIIMGRVGPYQVVRMTPKEMSLGDLANEAEMLETLRSAGLRTVPVYSTPQSVLERGVLIERAVSGNLLDAKEGFSRRQIVNLMAALFGFKGINSERGDLAPLEKKIMLRMAAGDLPSEMAIKTAIEDFTAIGIYMEKILIADLQGILEFRTGKFFIIDPLKLLPVAEKGPGEAGLVAYVETVIRVLGEFLDVVKRKKQQMQGQNNQIVPTIPGPPE